MEIFFQLRGFLSYEFPLLSKELAWGNFIRVSWTWSAKTGPSSTIISWSSTFSLHNPSSQILWSHYWCRHYCAINHWRWFTIVNFCTSWVCDFEFADNVAFSNDRVSKSVLPRFWLPLARLCISICFNLHTNWLRIDAGLTFFLLFCRLVIRLAHA